MATKAELRAAINAAIIPLEDRLATNLAADERQRVQAAYDALMLKLIGIDLVMLQGAADRVLAAARQLESVMRNRDSLAPAAYQASLAAASAALGAAGAAQPGAATGTGATDTPAGAASATTGDGWTALIAAYAADTGISRALKTASLAQWIIESNSGQSALARQHLNFGGIKFRERMVGYATPVDYTASDGDGVYCKFASVQAFIAGYWHFIESGPYEGWEAFRDDGPGYIRFIAARYASDPAYIDKVIGKYAAAAALLGPVPDAGAAAQPGAGAAAPVAAPAGATRVAVVIGHNSVSKGHGGQSPIDLAEYDWNGAVAEAMRLEAGHYNLEVGVFRRESGGGYTAEITRAYELVRAFGPVCAIELHYNGVDDPAGNGTEMLCRPDSTEAKRLGLALVAEVSGLLHLKIRHGDGLSLLAPGDRGAGSCYALDNVPTVLCEPFFVSNQGDRLAMAAAGQAALGRAYLRAIRAWIEG